MSNPFDPFAGLTPNLIPNPPGTIPEAPGAGNATASLTPFAEAQDVDDIVKNLVLDRPLKLYVPKRELYPDWEFRIINSKPQEIADAQNKGWRPVTDEKFSTLFQDLVAGTDDTGKAYRPILMARSKKIGEIIQKRKRQELANMYAGMDPKNKDLSGKYTKTATGDQSGTGADFTGAAWRIRV